MLPVGLCAQLACIWEATGASRAMSIATATSTTPLTLTSSLALWPLPRRRTPLAVDLWA